MSTVHEQLALPLDPPRYSARSLRLRQLVSAMAIEGLQLEEAWRFVADRYAADLASGSLARFESIWKGFARYARNAAGVEDANGVDVALVDRYLNALGGTDAPAPSTRSVRLSALRFLFERLRREGLISHDPTLDLRVDRPRSSVVPVLSDDDVERCRWVAESALIAVERWTATWAALEAGASTGEVALLTWRHVDADGSHIKVPQAPRTYERTIATTEWGQAALINARAEMDCLLAVTASSSYDARRTAVTHVQHKIFRRAGLTWARPRSLTAWVARRVLAETGRIDLAAHTVGAESLDRTADLIGHDWRAERP